VSRSGDGAKLRSALGVLLEREIARSGLSLNDFSRRAGVSPATASKLVNGQQRSASPRTLGKLAKVLDREPWQLEFLGADIPVDLSDIPEAAAPPGVLELGTAIEYAIDADPRIPPKRKRWLKQCVELARSAGT
jgi:transcriptional regulator with XRE-family HTH domain